MSSFDRLQQPFEVNSRLVMSITLPMTLAYLSTPLLGIVDTAIIGQLGNAALIGGIAVGAAIFDFIFASFNFLRASTTGLTAQALGRNNSQEQCAIYFRALLLAIGIGLILIALHKPILELGLYFIQPSPAVEAAVRVYFVIRVLAAPFSLINYVVLGWFLGLGKAGTGLCLQILLNGLNIVLNAILVLSFDFGVAGIAWGTFCSEIIAALVGFVLIYFHMNRQLKSASRLHLGHILDKTALLRLFSVNRDIMIRSLVLMFAFAFFTAQSARQNDIILAANTILMHFFLIGGYFLDGLATAAEQLVGRALGAGHRKNFVAAIRLTSLWGLGFATVLALVLWGLGPLFIDLITIEVNVRATARVFLLFAALTPVLGLIAFIMDGVFIGATWSKDMRNMMLFSAVFYITAWYFMMPLFGNTGLWLAFWLFISIRGVSLWWICQKRITQSFQPEG